jgi:hypothetical protein
MNDERGYAEKITIIKRGERKEREREVLTVFRSWAMLAMRLRISLAFTWFCRISDDDWTDDWRCRLYDSNKARGETAA